MNSILTIHCTHYMSMNRYIQQVRAVEAIQRSGTSQTAVQQRGAVPPGQHEGPRSTGGAAGVRGHGCHLRPRLRGALWYRTNSTIHYTLYTHYALTMHSL
jgi:hypothetical protein